MTTPKWEAILAPGSQPKWVANSDPVALLPAQYFSTMPSPYSNMVPVGVQNANDWLIVNLPRWRRAIDVVRVRFGVQTSAGTYDLAVGALSGAQLQTFTLLWSAAGDNGGVAPALPAQGSVLLTPTAMFSMSARTPYAVILALSDATATVMGTKAGGIFGDLYEDASGAQIVCKATNGAMTVVPASYTIDRSTKGLVVPTVNFREA